MKTRLTSDLAEFLGIVVGDGSISISKKKHDYRVTISGHLENDFVYLTVYVKWLIETLFNKRVYSWRFGKKKSFAIATSSKDVVMFLHSLGLPIGKKSQTVDVPKQILNSASKKIKAAFIRGVADTDFSVVFHKGSNRVEHTYPIIAGCTSSKVLADQVKIMLAEFDIKANINKRPPGGYSKVDQYTIYIYGRENLSKWMKHIGFSNPNHITKIEVWKKFGFYLPETSINERLILSKGIELLPRYATASRFLSGKGRLAA